MVAGYENSITNLKEIGLNEYEARAYTSLVGFHEATAREILEEGGIPQGRIYDVLKELAKKGFVEIQGGNPTYYRAIDPAEVIRILNYEYSQKLERALDTLKDLPIVSASHYPLWIIHNKQAIINRIFTLIRGAEKEIIIFSNNPVFFRQFSEELQRIQKHCDLTIIVDEPEKFSCRKLKFHKANEEFFYIMGNIMHDGIDYKPIFSLMTDEKACFDVMNIGNEQIGIATKIPVLTYIFRRWLKNINLLEESEN